MKYSFQNRNDIFAGLNGLYFSKNKLQTRGNPSSSTIQPVLAGRFGSLFRLAVRQFPKRQSAQAARNAQTIKPIQYLLTMKKSILAASIIGFSSLAILSHQAASADDGAKYSLDVGVDHNIGKYGSAHITEIWHVPVTVKYQDPSWTVKVTVPYLQILGPGNVIDIMNGTTATGTRSASAVTRLGFGDVVVSGSRYVYGHPSGLFVNVIGKVKIGTASVALGMGTGANDYALQSDIFKVTGNLTSFVTVGYKVIGSPPGYDLQNAYYGTLGASYKFSEAVYGGAALDLGQKVIANGSFHRQAMVFFGDKLDKEWKVQGYILQGFTNAVPDHGAGASVSHAL